MFTGIIQTVGKVVSATQTGQDQQLCIDLGGLDVADVVVGDSIAVNGVCLTAVAFQDNAFVADVSVETLILTTIGALKPNSRVNLELALTPSSRLGGHLVSGHVDGRGELIKRYSDARSERYEFRAPNVLQKYIAAKGSICIEGVSLTVNTVVDDTFSVNIVPHTQDVTTLGELQQGSIVNLEIDVVARYIERLLTAGETAGSSQGVTTELLRDAGFLGAGDH
ncbi:MAG: riboflavin synthase [Pseudomonadota bacterium]